MAVAIKATHEHPRGDRHYDGADEEEGQTPPTIPLSPHFARGHRRQDGGIGLDFDVIVIGVACTAVLDDAVLATTGLFLDSGAAGWGAPGWSTAPRREPTRDSHGAKVVIGNWPLLNWLYIPRGEIAGRGAFLGIVQA